MKTNIKKILAVLTIGLGIVVPVGVQAVADTQTTTITANIASVISMTTSATVAINITPTAGGSQSSASDSVSVSTNNSAGYVLTMSNGDTTSNLVKGADTITTHAGTQAAPTALANNTWGYAVATVGGFDASYSALTNSASSASKWAGTPSSASPNTIKTTAATATNDITTVWYSAKATTAKPNGAYVDTVSYTATTN